MKKLIIAIIGVAACTAFGQNADNFVDPNPYAKYEVAMTPDSKKQMAIEWHLNDRAAIDKATAPEALKAILDDECKVKSLLAEVKPGYNTPVMAAAQIAAISQYVMAGDNAAWWKFWADDRTQERKLWAKALLTAAAEAKDDYVTEYYLDQLRWCGMACQAKCVQAIADKSESKAVKDMAAIVIDQITGAAIN